MALTARLRPAGGEPEGALVLFHGRGADENDLFVENKLGRDLCAALHCREPVIESSLLGALDPLYFLRRWYISFGNLGWTVSWQSIASVTSVSCWAGFRRAA